MHLKASTDYGLRTVLYLAAHKTMCSSRDISHDMSIPRDYLIQLAQILRNGGILEGQAGKNGGYRLAKDPSEITLLHVMNALENNAKDSTREKRAERAASPMAESVKAAYNLAMESYRAFLSSITLDMLLECSHDSAQAHIYLAQCFEEESRRLAAFGAAGQLDADA